MRSVPALSFALLLPLATVTAHDSHAQACYEWQPACGYGPGRFRPQPFTLNRYFVPVPAPGMMYAPIGPNGQYWRQYDTGATSTYPFGPQEPNPFGTNGIISPGRALNHIYTTRILPRFSGH
jgi:hypothetical protein